MTNKDLDLAREWAEFHTHTELVMDGAAARVIQSLPDQIIDAEKVRAILHRNTFRGVVMDHCATAIVDQLQALLTPHLPTLAELTPEERQACQWMQCVDAEGDGSHGVIWMISEDYLKVAYPNGVIHSPSFEDITPRPDLPRLEWPGQEAPTEETRPAETLNNPSSDHSADLPRPEDVPEGEPWIVEHDGHEWVGTRDETGHTDYLWVLARLDGVTVASCADRDVTLVSRLVPEVSS